MQTLISVGCCARMRREISCRWICRTFRGWDASRRGAVIIKTKVTKTNLKTALKQATYNLSDLKHDLHCGFVELGGSVSVSS